MTAASSLELYGRPPGLGVQIEYGNSVVDTPPLLGLLCNPALGVDQRRVRRERRLPDRAPRVLHQDGSDTVYKSVYSHNFKLGNLSIVEFSDILLFSFIVETPELL